MKRDAYGVKRNLEVTVSAGRVVAVEPGSLAAEMGVRAGDEVLAVNGHPVEDVIDVQFYAAEDEVEITFLRNGHQQSAIRHRPSGQPLGIEFAHPTFDIDIRRCNNLCPFCFVLQTAPRMRRTLYIKDDDYRYSFLFGHFVTLTNLSAHDWERIEAQHLSPLYVSVHVTDLARRREFLRNPNAPDVMEQLRWLAERGIECHTQLVVTPGLNDGDYLERSVRDLATFYPSVLSVSVVPVGLTKHHKYGLRPNTVAEAHAVLDAVHGWQAEFRRACGVGLVYATDEWYLVAGREIPPREAYDGLALEENGLGQVRRFLEDWRSLEREVRRRRSSALRGRAATLITGTLFAPTLARTAQAFGAAVGARLEVLPVTNERLGATITVAGLLMGMDVTAQAGGRELGEFVVLPRVMFDHPQGVSLDDISPLTIARSLDRPLFLADAMGDVLHAFTGANKLRFDPAGESIPPEVMKAGGWAVEKYL